MEWFKRYFTRRRRFDDLAISTKEHLEEKVEELMEDGLSREDAENRARREFGNVTLMEEQAREIWRWPTLESILSDLKFALRQLAKAPGFTATAVLTLSLGIAVSATMFSLVSAFLLARLPGPDPQNVVVVSSINPSLSDRADTSPVSAPNYMAWRTNTNLFADIAAADEYRKASLAGEGQAVTVNFAAVSSNYFELFGVTPKIGHSFSREDDQPGGAHVVILSHGLWAHRFAADPAAIGRTIRLNRENYQIVGVMGPEFRLPGFTPQMWTPLVLTAADQTAEARKDRSLYLFARLAPGVTLAAARAQLATVARRAETEAPEIERRWGASVRMLPDFVVYNFGIRSGLTVLMTAVSFVLLIACANVSGLLLTRSTGRQKELAIRISLGASRARIVRQLVTEGLVIALLGGAAGLFLTYFGIKILSASLTFNEAISAVPVSLDSNVLVFVFGVSLLSAALSSLAPAFKSAWIDVNTGLKSESRTASSGRSHNRLRGVLVVGEVATALFLLTGTALLVHGIFLLDHQELGFRTDHLLTANLGLDQAQYGDDAHVQNFIRGLISRLKNVREVTSVAIASDLPATNPESVPVTLRDLPQEAKSDQRMTLDVAVTADYFQTAGIPLLRGRAFTEMDGANAPPVALVNQEFVRRYLQGKDPIGVVIKLDLKGASPRWSEIVGVVADVKSYSEETRVDPEVYESIPQRSVRSFAIMIRSQVDPNTLIPSLRAAVGELDRELPLGRVMSMDSVIEYQRNGNPFVMRALGGFSVLALILAAVGIYGLIAYSVGQRTLEICIRMAIGARKQDIFRMILRDGFKTAAIGSAIGLAISLPLPKLFDSVFEGIHFASPALHLIALAAILIVTVFATSLPALRAMHIDPKDLRNQ
jgi:predicted permease